MHNITPQLKDGSDWQQHTRCIVGDEAGLRNLITACEKAIELGEYMGSDLGDYIGVKKVASEMLATSPESKATSFVLIICSAAIFTFILLALVGFVTVLSWW